VRTPVKTARILGYSPLIALAVAGARGESGAGWERGFSDERAEIASIGGKNHKLPSRYLRIRNMTLQEI
jgi:hypothetical protein